MKAYPAYKETGLPWLGQTPEHWQIIRNKFLFREVEERSQTGSEMLLSLTRSRGLIPHEEHTDRAGGAESLVGYRFCRVGQIVMNRMQAWNGMFDVVRQEGLVSPDYTIFVRNRALNPVFFVHQFRSPKIVEQFRQRSRGIGSGFFRLYTPDFGDLQVPVPPIEEQDAIVAFLEAKEAEIQKFIDNQRQQVDLLTEQKTARINCYVTKGPTNGIRVKKSRSAWFGEIQTHWVETRLKFITTEIVDCLHATPEYRDDGEFPAIRRRILSQARFGLLV